MSDDSSRDGLSSHSLLVTSWQLGKPMGMRIGTEMPSLDGATEWFGGTQASAEAEAAGHPTLIHFWSLSCGTCKENMPRVAEWRDELKEQGLRVIAVHMPRYEADTDL